MIYSQLYLKEKRKIPTVIGALFVLLIVSFFVYVTANISIPSRATNSSRQVLEYETVNLASNREVTVFWRTSTKESGWVIVYDQNKKSLGKIFNDERDTPEKKSLYLNHYVILRQLPVEAAFFKLVAGDNLKIVYQYDKFYPLSFPKSYSTTNNLSPAYGIVLKPNGNPLEDAFVILTVADSYSLATRTKSKGEWLIPLNAIYDKKDLNIIVPTDEQEVKIRVLSEEFPSSNITTFFGNLRSLPKIIIGSDYRLLDKDRTDVLSTSTNGEMTESREIGIIFPQENAIIPGKNPLIKGIALPRSEVLITIESSKAYSSRVIADEDGFWKLVLPENLTAGAHKMTVITKNRNGQEVRLERKFNIAKVGEQVLGETTPEAAVAPTVPPTGVPVTGIPTQPVSGGNFSIFMLGSASMVVVGMGILLAF